VQLQEGADASRHRARSSAQLSTAATSSDAAAANGPRESVLQHWLVPDNQQRYWAIWTSVFTLSAAFIFAFMAGNFSVYQQSPTYSQYHSGSQMPVQVCLFVFVLGLACRWLCWRLQLLDLQRHCL
jgi:hypothetical protein